MWAITACLVPAAAWGVYVFGSAAATVLSVSVVAAVLLELVLSAIAKRNTIGDGSAVVTGLLIGMSMPPVVPLWVPIIANAFALAVVKWTFGGLGGNWMNPALAGRVFVFFCWNDLMRRWVAPATLPEVVDGVSAATPLSAVREGLGAGVVAEGPVAMLARTGYPRTGLDSAVTEWLNAHVFSHVGVDVPGGYVDLFVGNSAGSLGEVSALLLLLGSVYLVAAGISRWEISFSFFASFAALTFVFGGVPFGRGLFAGDVLFHLFTGGFVLVMFFMATDTVTAPMTSAGMLVYGVGCGGLAYLLRSYGAFPEGVALAVIVMNVFVPIIDRYTRPRRR
jgi:electron transport complex protein RnfD